MRQRHKAGEKCFVDYCGQTLPIINPHTGEIRFAEVFVAVLGASNYTFAEATWIQGLKDWLHSHVRAFEFFGGVPEMVIPDNLRNGVSRACRYDSDLNPSYQQLAAHYQVAILPARSYKPKDKAKAEVGVQVVERWILARLRHHSFFSLAEANRCIGAFLDELNARPFKQLPGNRRQAFEALDKPTLRSLPQQHSYEVVEIRQCWVNIDYHIEFDRHHYSVPRPAPQCQLPTRQPGGSDSPETDQGHPAGKPGQVAGTVTTGHRAAPASRKHPRPQQLPLGESNDDHTNNNTATRTEAWRHGRRPPGAATESIRPL